MPGVLRAWSLAPTAVLLSFAALARVTEGRHGFLAATLYEHGGSQEALLGHEASRARLDRLEESLRPIYTSLPKNASGYVEHGVARYVLHRYFSSHRAWHVKGLAPDGERWNSKSVTSMLESRVPDFILEMLSGSPIDLRWLAVLAATVEDLAHLDAIELLNLVYQVHDFSIEDPLADEDQEELVIRTYLLYFVLPWTRTKLNKTKSIVKFLPKGSLAYPGWDDTLLWVEDLKEAMRHNDLQERRPFSSQAVHFRTFSFMTRLVEQITDGFGLFQNMECNMMKNKLLDLQEVGRNDGRVSLASFYADFYADKEFWFTESPEYLKNLGALDDSDPSRPSVIVPNILYGPSNCLALSEGLHSICCVNQCDALMEHLEQGIAQPAATPAAIIELVSSLSSDTVAAPRNLSSTLHQKLGRIADWHRGLVPIHGRLFAQWMHHAFPSECPLPQALGAEVPLTHVGWKEQRGEPSRASVEVMEQVLAQSNASEQTPSAFSEAALVWTDEEELVTELDVDQWSTQHQPRAIFGLLRGVAMLTAGLATLASFATSLRSSALPADAARGKDKPRHGGSLPWFGRGPTMAASEVEWF